MEGVVGRIVDEVVGRLGIRGSLGSLVAPMTPVAGPPVVFDDLPAIGPPAAFDDLPVPEASMPRASDAERAPEKKKKKKKKKN